MQAINQDELKVPSDITKMEAEMKKEYAGAIRKAKLAVKAQEPGKDSSPAKGKMRKAEDQLESKNTKITVKADGMTIHIERSGSTPIQATPAKTPSKPKTHARPKEDKDKLATNPKEKPTAKAKSTTQEKSAPKEKLAATAKPGASKQQAATSTAKASSSPKKVEKSAKLKASTAATTTTSAAKSIGKQVAKRGGLTHQMPSARPTAIATNSASQVNPVPAVKPAQRPPQTARRGGMLASASRAQRTNESSASDALVQLTGVWYATCPELERLFPGCAGNLRLMLCFDSERNKLWGGFEIAYKKGVFLVDNPDRAVAANGPNPQVELKHRALNLEDGSRAFHRGCLGQFRIEADRTIAVSFTGLLAEMHETTLTARRGNGPLWCGKTESRFQEEWDAFVEDTYGRPVNQSGAARIRVKQEEQEIDDFHDYGQDDDGEDRDPYENYAWDDYDRGDHEDEPAPKFEDIDDYYDYCYEDAARHAARR